MASQQEPGQAGNREAGRVGDSPLAAETIGSGMGPREAAILEQRANLIREIRTNPESNQPRLAYAELLEQAPLHSSDKARAELIRLQVTRGSAPASEGEQALVREHGAKWEAAIAPARNPEWDRGFIVGVMATPDQFCAAADRLMREPVTKVVNPAFGGFLNYEWEGGFDLDKMLKSDAFRQGVQRLEFLSGYARTFFILLDNINSKLSLRQVHFAQFHDSVESIAPSGNKYENERRHYALNLVSVSEEGDRKAGPLKFHDTTFTFDRF